MVDISEQKKSFYEKVKEHKNNGSIIIPSYAHKNFWRLKIISKYI
jgi:hypothetical protein